MKSFVELIIGAAIGICLSVVIANWALGCGETYSLPSGEKIQGECLL